MNTETIVGGIAVSSFATLLGYVLGSKGRLTEDDFDKKCSERQVSCNTHICAELGHLKEELKEMKDDIKSLLKPS